MPYQVLARSNRHSAAEQVSTDATLQQALQSARTWLNANGKPGEAVAEIWDEGNGARVLTMLVNADGGIHDAAGGDVEKIGIVSAVLREITHDVGPPRYDFDHKEYRFAIEGRCSIAVPREFLWETADIAATLRSIVTPERLRNTGADQTLVLTSGGIKARANPN